MTTLSLFGKLISITLIMCGGFWNVNLEFKILMTAGSLIIWGSFIWLRRCHYWYNDIKIKMVQDLKSYDKKRRQDILVRNQNLDVLKLQFNNQQLSSMNHKENSDKIDFTLDSTKAKPGRLMKKKFLKLTSSLSSR